MNVVLGVGGGIAAYKAAEVARLLEERGFPVQTVMTAAAQEFVRPLTFAALTGKKVITDLFADRSGEDVLASAVEHIQVARENEVLLVAPATADLIGKFANGLASDFLTTLYLAFTGRVVLAPAMNTNMWEHPAVQENLGRLRGRAVEIVGPDEGPLACGTTGPGRLAQPSAIADAIVRLAATRRDLDGEKIVITAGPTEEPLDPVRFISNRSSGKMGYALAECAALRGARVTLITGPVAIPAPPGVEAVPIRTALEMREAVMENLSDATIIIKAAAVADYHVSNIPKQKMKKTAMRLSLELDPTPDILAEIGQKKEDRLLIGFAAETENLISEARRKLESKNCDMVVANLVGREGSGFEADENEVTLVMSTGESVRLELAPKLEVADSILDHALRLRLALHASR
jgi:phosphopantothenoylcysteine decarboxylase/phosphopantothenate--cysteine ligase